MCGYVVVLLWFCHPEAGLMIRSGLLLCTLCFSAPVNPALICMRLVFWTLYVCMYISKISLWVNKHAWPVDVVHLFLGCRNQRQDSDPRHGVPLWGGHAGYQAGVSAAVREVALHCHLCTSHSHTCTIHCSIFMIYSHMYVCTTHNMWLWEICVSHWFSCRSQICVNAWVLPLNNTREVLLL